MILQRGGGVRKDGTFGHDPRHIDGQFHPIFLSNLSKSCDEESEKN